MVLSVRNDVTLSIDGEVVSFSLCPETQRNSPFCNVAIGYDENDVTRSTCVVHADKMARSAAHHFGTGRARVCV